MPGRLPAGIPEYGAAVPAARIPGGVSAFVRRVFGRSILRFAAQRREASFQGKRGERRVVSTGDDGPGRAASESCGRFRKAAHVFVCRFDLADSCGFRPDGPVLSLSCSRPGFCTRRLRLGPCPESLPPEEGSCREPSASEIRRSAQRKLMRLGKHGGRIGRRIPGCD